MAKREFAHPNEMPKYVGQEIGVSDWVEVTQERINKFADATGDHQWIHVDVEKAKAGPFGTPIAHGYLTLSLVAGQFFEVLDLIGFKMIISHWFHMPAPISLAVVLLILAAGIIASVRVNRREASAPPAPRS